MSGHKTPTPLSLSRSQRPVMIDRTLSTPPTSPTDHMQAMKVIPHAEVSPLTPPTSPLLNRTYSENSSMGRILNPSPNTPSTITATNEDLGLQKAKRPSSTIAQLTSLLECPFDVETLKDAHGRDQKYGSGAWSTVFKAVGREKSAARGATIELNPRRASIPLLVAVKTPLRQNAIPIIRSEGSILSELITVPGRENHVVAFYGILPASQSLVLAALPLSLEDHIRSCAYKSGMLGSIWDVPGPIIGSNLVWLNLAERTISTLAWLHNVAGIVHGDLKPGNILLRLNWEGEGRFSYDPLLADFSSGQLLDADVITPNTLSAVTREYTAPELLVSSVLRNPESTATTASDVFSLAVTLLVAVTGELMVYPGSVYQRQAMATQGWYILSNVRNGDQGSRLPRHGVVEKVLERAVLKADMGRIDALSWKTLVREVAKGEPSKSKMKM